MTAAIVTLAIGTYRIGADVLWYSIRKHSDTTGVEFIPMDDEFIATDYTAVPVNRQFFAQTAKKLHALTLPYDRIIMLDADMLCVKDCSFLWSGAFGKLPFYACRDTAWKVYYPTQVADIGLNGHMIFNGGTMIYNRDRFPTLYENLMQSIASGFCKSYDGGDQGYLNHYLQATGVEVGFLPQGFNVVLDKNMPAVSPAEQHIIHFTGRNANPWSHTLPSSDWRIPYLDQWAQTRKEMAS